MENNQELASQTLFELYKLAEGEHLSYVKVSALIIAALFVGAVIVFSFWSNMLRDESFSENKPYSFSRTQLMWWTLVIGLCVILFCGARGEPPVITGTCLVLLGIGAATMVSARIIDSRQRDTAQTQGYFPLHQDAPSTRNLITDILSDEQGLSVHRFQSFVFNVVYGLAFLYSFCINGKFPQYNAEALTLLGISSAGYVGLKAFENSKPATVAGQNDELLDASVPPSQSASG